MKKYLNWLRYSGVQIRLLVNPLQWRWWPWATRFQDEWSGPNRRTVTVGVLFLTVAAWIDNGDW